MYVNGEIDQNFSKSLLNWKLFRSGLKSERDFLASKMKHPMPAHILDEAIKKSTANHKTCFELYKQKKNEKFHVRKWKKTKRNRMIAIEKGYFKNNTFCPRTFDFFKSSEDFSKIDRAVILQYSRDTKKYLLLVPEKIPMFPSETSLRSATNVARSDLSLKMI